MVDSTGDSPGTGGTTGTGTGTGTGADVAGHDRGTGGDHTLRVDVHGRGRADPGRDELRDQRDPRGAADEQQRGQVGGRHMCRGHRLAHRVHGLQDRGPDHLLELCTPQPHGGVRSRQHHRNLHLGVDREHLLRRGALPAQPGDRGEHRGVGRVELVPRRPERLLDVLEHDLVEVDAAEAFEPFRTAEQLEAAHVAHALAHHGSVERPTAQVVDGHDRAGIHTLRAGVADGGRLRLGQHQDRSHTLACECGLQ
jgi:hypothetical protein